MIKTAVKMAEEMRARKDRRIAEADDKIIAFRESLAAGERAMQKLELCPATLNEYAIEKGKADLSRAEISKEEKMRDNLKHCEYDIATEEETAAYNAQVKREALVQLRDLARTQIGLYTSLEESRQKSYQIRADAMNNLTLWDYEYMPSRKDNINAKIEKLIPGAALCQAPYQQSYCERAIAALQDTLAAIEAELEQCK